MRAAFGTMLLLVAGLAPAGESPFQRTHKLEREGKEKEAFLAYLEISGAEYAAARLARPKAEAFLEVVRGDLKGPGGVFRPRAKLVEADLLLALGRKDEALACYRKVLTRIGEDAGRGWNKGFMPADYYPVEPPASRQASRALQPFALGPGSHRDNWLIRRLIALDAWEDTRSEFARIWKLHRARARPYVAAVPVYQPPAEAGGKSEWKKEKRLFRPAGLDGRGLQFAIDHAYFLKRREKLDEALAVLMEPLLLVDMDRNPNLAGAGEIVTEAEAEGYPERPARTVHGFRFSPFWGASAGVSRKEFIRLAFGEFKTAGREAELVAALEKQIGQGRNAARRVLARVRLHRGNLPECLALELAYIERGGFDELSAAYRRGLVYEDCRKLAEAAAEYEKALAAPFKPPKIPDKDEEATQGQMSCAALPQYFGPGSTAVPAAFHSEILGRLQRLYGSLAQGDKVLDVSLRQYEVNHSLIERFESAEGALRRFRASGKEEEFRDWAKKQLPRIKYPAALFWVLGDHAAAARALAEQAGKPKDRPRNPWAFTEWKKRFRSAGKDKLRVLLKALVEADPKDAKSRLELLDLQDRWDPEEVIPALETLLGQDASYAFARGKGDYNRTRFRNYFDLAYRLMRLYEKTSETDKLKALGLRVARGEKPFARHDLNQHTHRSGNALPEDITACLSLVVQHADDAATRDAFEKALRGKPWPWTGALRQLSRRCAGGIKAPAGLKPFGWANAPEGVTLIASNENVLSLARDEKYVYAGHPWGIAVYDFAGEPLTRVALATAARELLTHAGHLWAGTPKGLYRVATGNWRVAHLACDQDLGPHGPQGDNPWHRNAVQALAADGDKIWIGTLRNVQVYDTREGALRVYSREELGIEQNTTWNRFLVEKDYVWADGRAGCRRYDRKTDTWSAVTYDGKTAGLIGTVGGKLWGHVWVSNKLRDRPCIVDRGTLQVTPVLIGGDLTKPGRCTYGGPFSYFGTYQGKPVFGPEHPAYVYDEETGKLRLIGAPWDRKNDPIESRIPLGLRSGTPRWRADGAVVCHGGHTHRHTVFGRPFNTDRWTLLSLPDGTLVLGGACPGSLAGPYPEYHWFYVPRVHERPEGTGGLHFVSPDGRSRCVSAVSRSDSIMGDVVVSVLEDRGGQKVWLCTDHGLGVLDSRGGVLANVSRRDGLCANRVTSGASAGGRLYFSTGRGDHGGGLAVFDPKTCVFTALFQSDGLATDKLAEVRPKGRKLELVYDIECGRGAHYRYRRFPPGTFDPASGKVRSGGEARYMEQAEAHKDRGKWRRAHRRAMPCLGGFVVSEGWVNGKTYLCGTRGLVGLEGKAAPSFAVHEIQAKVVVDENERLRRQAKAMEAWRVTYDEVVRRLQHPNPFVREQALQRAIYLKDPAEHKRLIEIVVGFLKDRRARTRLYAFRIVAKVPGEPSNTLLSSLLQDEYPPVRDNATIELARRGLVTDPHHIEPALRRFHYGGTELATIDTYTAIAAHATPGTFRLLMKYPAQWDKRFQQSGEIFGALGAALLRRPDSADVLLTAYGPYRVRYFARDVFRFAGKPMLPVLHEALASKDRVVRSNAARACGAIADPSSIPHLIKALDLESGLSRASVVWALGELKAKEALPELVKLYIDARNDEERRRGSGFRAAQSAALIQAHYDSLRNLDAIGADWNELKAAALPEPVDPRANEELLSPKHVLEAVRKIGPAAAQGFYRTLAGEKDSRGRREAAERLAEGGPEDREKNLPILRNLLADDGHGVRVRAAVSLVVLGDAVGERHVSEFLDSHNRWEKGSVLGLLCRVKDGRKLCFARDRIAACARDPDISKSLRQEVRMLVERIPRR